MLEAQASGEARTPPTHLLYPSNQRDPLIHPRTGELAAAEPAMKAAAAAVDVLSKPMLTELKNLKVRP